MKPCEHSAFVHNFDEFPTCYWCGVQLVFVDVNPTPRDEVDAFISTLKGVAR